MEHHKNWIEECDAARDFEYRFGTERAVRYLVREKFLSFLAAAEKDLRFQAEIPAFVAEIRTIFKPGHIKDCLNTARQSDPYDPNIYEDEEDPELIEQARINDLRKSANDLLVVARASEWLLDG
jgi:hypothetical protein